VTPSAAATASAAPAIGQLGRYRLIRSLGVGGQAEVFQANYSGPGGFERTVVIKRVLPANCQDPEFLRMFAAEARILGMLHHPNVVQAYDVGESDGALFLVLEYVDGPSLAHLLRALRTAAHPLPLAIAAYFAREICRALDYVHGLHDGDGAALNVIHRDVTPSNIALTRDGSLKLLDFGIARYESSTVQTRDRTVKGKPAYLAPEAIDGRPFDRRVDLFSVGVVLHEMLTLSPLFRADHDLAILHKVMEMPIPPPSAGAGRHRHEGARARSRAPLRHRRRIGTGTGRIRGRFAAPRRRRRSLPAQRRSAAGAAARGARRAAGRGRGRHGHRGGRDAYQA
jgi:serine/threonine protein kinase